MGEGRALDVTRLSLGGAFVAVSLTKRRLSGTAILATVKDCRLELAGLPTEERYREAERPQAQADLVVGGEGASVNAALFRVVREAPR
jgi:hypothetical protein